MSKTLFITGASSGIGEATARAAVAAGWRVGLFARSADRIDALARDLGDQALPLPGDATDLDAKSGALARMADLWGGVDAAFANAGMGVASSGIGDGDPDAWEAMIRLNVTGVLWTARAALPHLRPRKGHLVLTGSAAGRIHLKGSVYGATKWFVHGLAGNLAEEMREWGGRCTVIAPGIVNTAFFDEDLPEKLQPKDIADAVMLALEAHPRCAVREVYLMPND